MSDGKDVKDPSAVAKTPESEAPKSVPATEAPKAPEPQERRVELDDPVIGESGKIEVSKKASVVENDEAKKRTEKEKAKEALATAEKATEDLRKEQERVAREKEAVKVAREAEGEVNRRRVEAGSSAPPLRQSATPVDFSSTDTAPEQPAKKSWWVENLPLIILGLVGVLVIGLMIGFASKSDTLEEKVDGVVKGVTNISSRLVKVEEAVRASTAPATTETRVSSSDSRVPVPSPDTAAVATESLARLRDGLYKIVAFCSIPGGDVFCNPDGSLLTPTTLWVDLVNCENDKKVRIRHEMRVRLDVVTARNKLEKDKIVYLRGENFGPLLEQEVDPSEQNGEKWGVFEGSPQDFLESIQGPDGR
jgi:hypothetical protein